MKKQKDPPKEPLRLYISYTEDATGGESRSNEPYSDREDEHREVTFNLISRLKSDNFFCDSEEVSEEIYKSDKIWMVVVRYTDGDTFGTTYGNWKRIGLYNSLENAENVAESIQDGSYSGYKCWDGYFERLENVEIHEFNISDEIIEDRRDIPRVKVIKH